METERPADSMSCAQALKIFHDAQKSIGLAPHVSSQEERDRSFRKLALKLHPDKLPAERQEEATLAFQNLSRANDVLKTCELASGPSSQHDQEQPGTSDQPPTFWDRPHPASQNDWPSATGGRGQTVHDPPRNREESSTSDDDPDCDQEDDLYSAALGTFLLGCCSASEVAAGFSSITPVPDAVPSGFGQGTFATFKREFLPFVQEEARSEAAQAFEAACAGQSRRKRDQHERGPAPDDLADLVVRARAKTSWGEEYVQLKEVNDFGGVLSPRDEALLSAGDVVILLPEPLSGQPPFPLDLSRERGALLLLMSGRRRGILPSRLGSPAYSGNELAKLLRGTLDGSRVELRAVRAAKLFLHHVRYEALAFGDVQLCGPIDDVFAGRAPSRSMWMPPCPEAREVAMRNGTDSTLHRAQQDIVEAAANLKQGVLVAWGPPGTGKTKTLVPVIYDQYCLHCCQGREVGCCAPTNRAIRELCQRFVAARGNDVGLAKVLLFRSQRAELGKATAGKGVELLQSVDMHERTERIRAWLFSEALDRVRAVLRRPVTFLNETLRSLEALMEDVILRRVSLSPQKRAALEADLQLFRDGKLFTILHREMKSSLEQLRQQTNAIERDVRGASRNELMQSISAAQEELTNVLQSQALDSILATLDQVAFERHWLPDVNQASLEQTFEERVSEVISTVRATALEEVARQRRELLRLVGNKGRASLAKLQRSIIGEAGIVFSTTVMAPLLPMNRSRLNWVSVLVDEAGQVPVADLAAIAEHTWQRLFLVGDDKQLPAVVTGEGCENAGFGRSLLERVRTNPAMNNIVRMLDTQFRMDPIIAAFSSQEFYNGLLQSSVQTPNPLPKAAEGLSGEQFLGGIMIFDTSWLPTSAEQAADFDNTYPKDNNGLHLRNVEYKPSGSPSWANEMEAYLIKRRIQQFERTIASSRESWSVGVIAPYASQVELLNKALQKWMRRPDVTKLQISVAVGTVDSFQGSEADIIILSTVRSNRYGNIGFLSSERRLNVAFTRARFALWIFGNVRTLKKKQGTVWSTFLGKFVASNSIPVVKMDEVFRRKKAAKWTTQEQDASVFLMRDSLLANGGSTPVSQAGKVNLRVLSEGLSVDDLLEGARPGAKAWKVAREERLHRQMLGMKAEFRLPIAWCIHQIAEGRHFAVPDAECTGVVEQDFPHFAINLLHLQPTKYYLLWYVLLDEMEHKQMIVVAELVERQDIPNKRQGLARRLMSGQSAAYLEACCVFERPVGDQCTPKHFPHDHAALRRAESGPVCALAEADVSRELRKLHLVTGNEWLTQILLQLRKSGPEVELPLLMSAEQERLKTELVSSLGILAGRGGSGKTEVLLNVGLAAVLSLRKAPPYDEAVDPRAARKEEQRLIPALLVTQSTVLAKELKQRAASLLRVSDCTPPDDFESWPKDDKRTYLQEIVKLSTSSRHDSDLAQPVDFDIGTKTQDMLTMTVRQTLHALDCTLVGKRFFGSSVDLQSHGNDFQHGEVTFVRFRDRIWPKIQNKLRSGKFRFSAISVYKEIMDIKARNEGNSPSTLNLKTLSKEEYVGSEQRSRTFKDKAERETMYQLYLVYEKEKCKGDWDICDLCDNLWTRFKRHGYTGQKACKLLSDESQDLHRSEILVLSILVATEDSCVFAYDMAQTIAEGRKFDVKTVKDILYARFGHEDTASGSRDDDRMSQLTRKLHARYLSVNFRAHVGVLEAVALFCVDAMKAFFRDQIDAELPRETSLETGPPPTLVHSVSDAEFRAALFSDGAEAEYGAKHTIIVFDPEEKKQVAAFLRVNEEDLERVFTPAEAKGLQFASVLVWKFFANRVNEHPCWPFMYQMLQDAVARPSGLLDRYDAGDPEAEWQWQSFKQRIATARQKWSDGDRDKWVRELKMLYVVLTRSQSSVILYEGGCSHADAAAHGSQLQLVQDFLCLAPYYGLLGQDGGIITSPEPRQARKPLLLVADTVAKLGEDAAVLAFGTVSNAQELEAEAAKYFAQEMFDQASKMFKKTGSIALATVADVRQLWRSAERQIKDAPVDARRNAARAADILSPHRDRGKVQRIPVLEEFRDHPAMASRAADLQESFAAIAQCFKFVGHLEEAAVVFEQFLESKTRHHDAGVLYQEAARTCKAGRRADLAQRAAEQFEEHGKTAEDGTWARRCFENLLVVADCTESKDGKYVLLFDCIDRHRERLPDEIKLEALDRVGTAVNHDTASLTEARKQRGEREAAARLRLAECKHRIELMKKEALGEEARGSEEPNVMAQCGVDPVLASKGTNSGKKKGKQRAKTKKDKKGTKPSPGQPVVNAAVDAAGLRKRLETELLQLQREIDENRDTPALQCDLLLSTPQGSTLFACARLLTDETAATDFLARHKAAVLGLAYWRSKLARLQELPAEESDAREALRVLRRAADCAELLADWPSALSWHAEAGGAAYSGIRVSRTSADRVRVFQRCELLMSGGQRHGVTRAIDADCAVGVGLEAAGDCPKSVVSQVMDELLASHLFVEEALGDFDGIRMASYVRAFVAHGFVPPTSSVADLQRWYMLRKAWCTLLLDGPKIAAAVFPERSNLRGESLAAAQQASRYYCLTELLHSTSTTWARAELNPAVLKDFGARKVCDGRAVKVKKIVACYHLSKSSEQPLVQSVEEFHLLAHAHYTLFRGMLFSALAHSLLFRVVRSPALVSVPPTDVNRTQLCKDVLEIEKLLSSAVPQERVQNEIACLIGADSMDVVAPLATLREVVAAAVFEQQSWVTVAEFLAMLDRELARAASGGAVVQILELLAFSDVRPNARSDCLQRIRKRAEACAKGGLVSKIDEAQQENDNFENLLVEVQKKAMASGPSAEPPDPETVVDLPVVRLLETHATLAEKMHAVLHEAVKVVESIMKSKTPSRRSIRAALHYTQRVRQFSVFPEPTGAAAGYSRTQLRPLLELEATVLSKLEVGRGFLDEVVDSLRNHVAREAFFEQHKAVSSAELRAEKWRAALLQAEEALEEAKAAPRAADPQPNPALFRRQLLAAEKEVHATGEQLLAAEKQVRDNRAAWVAAAVKAWKAFEAQGKVPQLDDVAKDAERRQELCRRIAWDPEAEVERRCALSTARLRAARQALGAATGARFAACVDLVSEADSALSRCLRALEQADAGSAHEPAGLRSSDLPALRQAVSAALPVRPSASESVARAASSSTKLPSPPGTAGAPASDSAP